MMFYINDTPSYVCLYIFLKNENKINNLKNIINFKNINNSLIKKKVSLLKKII